MKTKRNERGHVTNVMLRTLAKGGTLALAVAAPKMLTLLKYTDRAKNNREKMYARITAGLYKLEKKGFVTVKGTYGERRVSITSKGKAFLLMSESLHEAIPEQAFWDGKWRVLMFDIEEKKKNNRDALRHMLQKAGFVKVQDSVWVYPYPCEEFIALVRAHLKSGVGEMRLFVAEALESDRVLREHFKLESNNT